MTTQTVSLHIERLLYVLKNKPLSNYSFFLLSNENRDNEETTLLPLFFIEKNNRAFFFEGENQQLQMGASISILLINESATPYTFGTELYPKKIASPLIKLCGRLGKKRSPQKNEWAHLKAYLKQENNNQKLTSLWGNLNFVREMKIETIETADLYWEVSLNSIS